jgi:Tfp pilus assembly protein PilN
MVKDNFKQIDLLRNRRKTDYLADPYFIDTNKYRRKGILSGLILISISLIIGIPFIFRTKLLENQKIKLKPFTEEYDLLEKKLDQESKQLKEIARFNKNLKNSILNISSSSALFKEISLIIPKDIQLLEFTSTGNTLLMKAKLHDQKYLGTLNSFLLNLDNSEFIEFNNIDLKEIKSDNTKNKDKVYLFEINTKVSTNYSQLNKNYLIKLGSYGLFNRLNLLNNLEATSD